MNVFITGVSSGLGLELGKIYMQNGNNVYGLSRRIPEDLIDNKTFIFQCCDLADLDQIENHLTRLFNSCNELDLVFLNAGILGDVADIADTSLNHMKQVMDINLWANKIILDHIYSRNINVKQIIAISSGAAVSGQRGWSGYGISKAALNMLIKLYAAEKSGTHFSALAPGLIDTRMQEKIRSIPDATAFEVVNRLKKAAGTSDMQTPQQAARKIYEITDSLIQFPSGDFVDIRKINLSV